MRKYIISVLAVIVGCGGLASSTQEALTAYLNDEKEDNRSIAILKPQLTQNLRPSLLLVTVSPYLIPCL